MRIIIVALCIWSCQAAQVCQRPEFNEGFLVPNMAIYQTGAKVYYGCHNGLKPSPNRWWGEMRCEDGVWSHSPRCIGKPTACDQPSRVFNAVVSLSYQLTYEEGDRVEYVCRDGYELVGERYSTCHQNQWSSVPRCVLKKENPNPRPRVFLPVKDCGDFPDIEKGAFLMQADGMALNIFCFWSYKLDGPETVRCVNGNWTELPVCKRETNQQQNPRRHKPAEFLPVPTEQYRKPNHPKRTEVPPAKDCRELPYVENGDVFVQANGMTLRIQCARFYKLDGPDTVRCVNGKWSKLSVCKPPCVLDEGRIAVIRIDDKYLQEGETKRMGCYRNHFLKREVSCVDGIAHYGEC